MMIGESRRPLHIPPFPLLNDDLADETLSPPSYRTDHHDHPTINGMHKSPYHLQDIISALQRYLPSGLPDQASEDSEHPCLGPDSPVDLYSCDDFRMYEFKVRQCARGKSHDWTECPYAHPGEKARRRDPRVFPYSGTACSDFRNGHCKKGDACEFAHGVFECWLHPTRYRTQPCKDGSKCRRRVCFFAHAPEQLRVVAAAAAAQEQSPRSMSTISADESSPPVSPVALSMSHSFGPDSLAEVIGSLRNLQLEKVKSLSPSLSMQMCGSGSGIWSPRGSNVRPGFYSLPATPTRTPTVGGIGYFDSWESSYEEEPVMERVESGRSLRAKIFEKLTEEILSDRARPE